MFARVVTATPLTVRPEGALGTTVIGPLAFARSRPSVGDQVVCLRLTGTSDWVVIGNASPCGVSEGSMLVTYGTQSRTTTFVDLPTFSGTNVAPSNRYEGVEFVLPSADIVSFALTDADIPAVDGGQTGLNVQGRNYLYPPVNNVAPLSGTGSPPAGNGIRTNFVNSSSVFSPCGDYLGFRRNSDGFYNIATPLALEWVRGDFSSWISRNQIVGDNVVGGQPSPAHNVLNPTLGGTWQGFLGTTAPLGYQPIDGFGFESPTVFVTPRARIWVDNHIEADTVIPVNVDAAATGPLFYRVTPVSRSQVDFENSGYTNMAFIMAQRPTDAANEGSFFGIFAQPAGSSITGSELRATPGIWNLRFRVHALDFTTTFLIEWGCSPFF